MNIIMSNSFIMKIQNSFCGIRETMQNKITHVRNPEVFSHNIRNQLVVKHILYGTSSNKTKIHDFQFLEPLDGERGNSVKVCWHSA